MGSVKKPAIRRYPDPVLRQMCEPVTEFDQNLRDLVHRMKLAMVSEKGLGLAANQIGVTKRVILVRSKAMVNPEITAMSGIRFSMPEGCLSFPGKRVCRPRWRSVTVAYQTVAGEPQTVGLSGLDAQIAQHEIEHLNGVLLCD